MGHRHDTQALLVLTTYPLYPACMIVAASSSVSRADSGGGGRGLKWWRRTGTKVVEEDGDYVKWWRRAGTKVVEKGGD